MWNVIWWHFLVFRFRYVQEVLFSGAHDGVDYECFAKQSNPKELILGESPGSGSLTAGPSHPHP